ncbi:MAG: VOC family protein [Pseudomonadota bacterium]
MAPALIPELYVSDLKISLSFYCDTLGFDVAYQRAEDKFACLRRGEATLMLEEPVGRIWLVAALERPFGRGLNLQISVANVASLFASCLAVKAEILAPLETRTYRRRDDKVSQTQFVVQDPDGYLIRLAEIRELKG